MESPVCADFPDWRNAAAYADLLNADSSAFAWEWLRRRPDYRRAAAAGLAAAPEWNTREDHNALAWGLCRFEDFRLTCPVARPVWSAARCAWIIRAAAQRCATHEDRLDLVTLAPFMTIVDARGGESLLLSNGYRTIRLDLRGDSLLGGPVCLTYTLTGVRTLTRPLLILQRLHSLVARRRFVTSLYPRLRRGQRLIQLLRTADALDVGAEQWEIAQTLLRPGLERQQWRIRAPSLRSRAQRLVREARRMRGGGFWNLLQ